MATRWMAILILFLAGLPRVGIGAGEAVRCDDAACRPVVVQETCCGTTVIEACPANGGKCRCGMAPDHHRDERPQAPQPRTERLPLVTIALSVSRLVWRASDVPPPHLARGLLDPTVALTHNEVQALLGIWRT